MAGKIYVGDIGTVFRLTMKDPETQLPIDLSAAASLVIQVQDPDGDILNWAAVLAANIGELEYRTKSGDLAKAGDHQLQALVDLGSWNGRSETVTTTIYAPFK